MSIRKSWENLALQTTMAGEEPVSWRGDGVKGKYKSYLLVSDSFRFRISPLVGRGMTILAVRVYDRSNRRERNRIGASVPEDEDRDVSALRPAVPLHRRHRAHRGHGVGDSHRHALRHGLPHLWTAIPLRQI